MPPYDQLHGSSRSSGLLAGIFSIVALPLFLIAYGISKVPWPIIWLICFVLIYHTILTSIELGDAEWAEICQDPPANLVTPCDAYNYQQLHQLPASQ